MTTVRVGNRRLLVLAAFLRKLPRKRFDYGAWVGEGWRGAQDLSCGTTGCALGWAATMPIFRRLGLHLEVSSGVPTCGGRSGTGAGEAIFALSDADAMNLFYPSDNEANATPTYVARKIEKFVRGRAP